MLSCMDSPLTHKRGHNGMETTLKIKLSPQEASVLYSSDIKIEVLCEDDIGDSEVLHKKLELFSQNICNKGAISQSGEIICDENIVILKNTNNVVLDMWKGYNAKFLIQSRAICAIRLQIDSNEVVYLVCTFDEVLGIVNYLLESMLHSFDIQNNPTQKGIIIESLIDKLLEVGDF